MARKRNVIAPNNKKATETGALVKKIEEKKVSIQEAEKIYGDGLPYEIDRIENEIRFYQEQAGQSLIEMGKRFIRIKAHEEHGRFLKALDFVGMAYRSAAYAMAAARKFANVPTLAYLDSSKVKALSVLDDDSIKTLEDGGEVRGVTIDEIEKMSVRELREALRGERKKHQHDVETREKAIKKKEEKINELDELLRYQQPLSEKEKAEKAIEAKLEELRKKLFSEIQLARFHFGETVNIIATARQLEGVTFPMLEKWAKEEYEELAGFNDMFEELDEALNFISVDKGKRNGK